MNEVTGSEMYALTNMGHDFKEITLAIISVNMCDIDGAYSNLQDLGNHEAAAVVADLIELRNGK